MSRQCSVAECEGKVRAWGWCGKHYQRWKKTGNPEGMIERHQEYHRTPEAERFWPKVAIGEPDECWEWTANSLPAGYGLFAVCPDGKWIIGRAHRWSYEHHHGPIPAGMVVHHTCNNPPCVNPRHLTVMQQAEHALIGGAPPARNARKTHCPNGHEYSTENTHFWTNGERHCRVCDRERKRAKHVPRGPIRPSRRKSA